MIGEIIAIGDELTSGRILNTNSRYAAGQLFSAGHEIIAMATISDIRAEIGAAIKKAIKRSDFVIVTGGLGATSDDLTNEAVASALQRPPTLHPEILAKIKEQLPNNPGKENATLEKLAWLPAGAEVLKPEARMAGYLLIHDDTPVFFLPGVPHEMKELLAERVIPRLALWKEGATRQVLQKVYKIFGLAEIEINNRLSHLEKSDPEMRLGYYPVFPEVHLSLTITGEERSRSEQLFNRIDKEIQTILGDNLFGFDDDTMESVIGSLLKGKKKNLAVAESCSGGLIAHRITKVPGSSAYFTGGVVAYSNDLKTGLLGVDPVTIDKYGAVSGETAKAMAIGIRKRSGADIGVAVTGIAGPDGGTDEKPVGTVFFGLASEKKAIDFCCHFSGDRWKIQEMTAQTALNLVRLLLLDKKLTSQ